MTRGNSRRRSAIQFPARERGRLILGILICALVAASAAGRTATREVRPISVAECVGTRRVVDGEVQISPDGSRVAYVVKAPNAVANRNDYRLYVRSLNSSETRVNGALLLQADGISGLGWLSARRLIAQVSDAQEKERRLQTGLYVLDVLTGARTRLVLPEGVRQFSASAGGRRIVFSAALPQGPSRKSADQQRIGEERGFVVRYGEGSSGSNEHLPEDALYCATADPAGGFTVKRLYFRESWDSQKRVSLRNVIGMDLSPDGRYLLLVYSTRSLPPAWADDPYVREAHGLGTFFDTYVLGLYDLESGALRLGFNFAAASFRVRWSGDSRAYGVIAPSPLGTRASAAEEAEAAASGNLILFMLQQQHLFTVDVRTGSVERVLSSENEEQGRKSSDNLPLNWRDADGPMLIRTGGNSFAWMTERSGSWEESRRFDLGMSEKFLSSVSSDGQTMAGVAQAFTVPPDLLAFDLKSHSARILTDLNPELREVRLGNVERLEWTNRYGSKCAGLLIKPPEFEEGTHYPMVFLAAPPQDIFISDAVYTTAYAPQPLATAGFVVVMAQYPIDNRIPRDRYPGEIREAYNWMSMVESAVDLLASRGMVDRNNVGIGGFSRTSWLVDFTLTHSPFPFAAASSADGGIYTYGSYFEHNSAQQMRGSESELGGPPYGAAFQQWLDDAPPFSADKVRPPLLMEYTGTGGGVEFFTALSRLGKAVEFYRYPKGAHPLDTPYERVASLERNLDWFRFWMQGYEGEAPSYDPGQYARWRRLREEQHWNDRMRADGRDPGAEFLRETSPGGLRGVADPSPIAADFGE